MEEELENQDSLNTDETLDSHQEPEVDAELLKAKEVAENQRIRAEKAERELKALKKAPVEEKKEDISWKDVRALQDVPDEDMDEVIEYARFKGVTVAEAKSSAMMKTLLKTKAEERASAAAASVKPAKRGAPPVSQVDILKKFHSHDDMSNEERMEVIDARFASRRTRK